MRWLVLLLALSACAAPRPSPYEPASESRRNTARAQELSSRAADLLYDSPEEAESLLREALTEDIFFGPAHNNLGVLYLTQDKLYEAANEFEWARRVMPGHPDPRMNLALTLEKAGKWDEAIQTYKTALEVYPGHIPTEQALARILVRHAPESPDLPALLDRIRLRGETPAWRQWARNPSTRHLSADVITDRQAP
ncbi:MAG TPA: tetratricopeptide repeat protein [Planctomycetes bacterium]|nr:tetratricopeptide repeat protein [Planctomycetota bacterium]